jgi:hypothetical protein
LKKRDTFEERELLVQLQELERRARAEADLLGLAVVNVL